MVQQREDTRYVLSGDFLDFFRPYWEERLSRNGNDPGTIPAEHFVHAIYSTAFIYQVPRRRLERDPRQIWPAGRPLREAWQRYGDLPETFGETHLYLGDPGGKSSFRMAFSRPLIPATLAVRSHIRVDKSRLPKIDISIEGEPVAFLLKAQFLNGNPAEAVRIRAEAKRIWDCVFKAVAIDFNVASATASRPRTGLGREAARLHDHLGYSWKRVARELCPQDHCHSNACKERYRTAARDWWKEQQNSFQALPPLQ